MAYKPNTLETLRNDCSKVGWDGYDAPPISKIVFDRAIVIEPYIPKCFELFPGTDNSLHWEWNEHRKNDVWFIIEIYENRYYFTTREYDREFIDTNEFIEHLKKEIPECLHG
jgi:hypothetical protein